MFEPGRVYRRDQLHLEYGGGTQLPRQGGMLTPRGQAFMIVVTGEVGEQYGYRDEWDSDGVFHYYGAGQDAGADFDIEEEAKTDAGWGQIRGTLWGHCELSRPSISSGERSAIVLMVAAPTVMLAAAASTSLGSSAIT